ncbi:MAG: ANTAR domain-containing protein [Ruminiclostridium sp.]|nr:ANTAR domain-containing protein [Ruminiclostridium sp.]
MKKVLIAAKTTEACRILGERIDPETCEVTTATDGMTVRGIDLSRYDVIFISVPLENESGLELLSELREKASAHLVAIVREEAADAAVKRLAPLGVYIVTKPVSKTALMQAIRFCETNAVSEESYRRRIAELEAEAEHERLMHRATLIVMGKESLTEDEAHRRIQKLAMDLRVPKYEVAADIINGLLI